MRHICSACGHVDFENDPFDRGDWHFDIDWVSYRSVPVRVSPQQFVMLRALAITKKTLSLEQIGIHAAPESNPEIISVQLAKIRARLRDLGLAPPFVSVWGLGYKWIADS